MQYLLFRFDASSDIGLGHAFRCAALIEHLNLNSGKYSVKCLVLAKVLPEFLQEKLRNIGAKIHLLDNTVSVTKELDEISTLTKQYASSVLVLDGYQFDQAYSEKLAGLNNNVLNIVVFDDTNDFSNLFCQLVINALPDAKKLKYEQSAPDAKQLIGLPYSIIRQEFLVEKPMRFSEREIVLINFGGSDIGGLTLPVIEGIAEQLLANKFDCVAENIVVVTGGGCEDIEKIQTLCYKMNFRHLHQCDHMAKLLNKTRLAICAPGAIVYELAYCQVPSLFITIADNQLLSANAHQQAGWSMVFDGRSEHSVQLALAHFTKLWQNEIQLQNMSLIASKLVDGKGVERIIDVLIEIFYTNDFAQKEEIK